MALEEIKSAIDARIAELQNDATSVALIGFDGDGTVFVQNLEGNPWDINPAKGAVAYVTKIGRSGHYPLLTSARGAQALQKSPFATVDQIAFHANDGFDKVIKGQIIEGGSRPDFTKIKPFLQDKLGTFVDAKYENMGHFFGLHMWNTHQSYHEAGDVLKQALPLVTDTEGHVFEVVSPPEGHYIVPMETPGKLKAYQQYAEDVGKTIGLYFMAGNGGNDRMVLEDVAKLPKGIAVWVGSEAKKPEGTFCVPDPDTLAEVLGYLADNLPARN
jgi:hypothetical protein